MNEKPTNREGDKRVLKTKKAIREALLAILEEKPMKEISVSELSERACINRKTFYLHYTSLDDVLDELEEELIANVRYYLRSVLITEENLGPQYFLHFINTAYLSNPTFFENLVTDHNYAFLTEKLKNVLKEELLVSFHQEGAAKEKFSFLLDYVIGGITAMYVNWIKAGKPVPYENFIRMIVDAVFYGAGSFLSGMKEKKPDVPRP